MTFPLNRSQILSYNAQYHTERGNGMREMNLEWIWALLMALAIVVFINIASFS